VLDEFHRYYPLLNSRSYSRSINIDDTLKDADLVIVHEWNEHWLVEAVGESRKKLGFRLLFHDTHHRVITDKPSMRRYKLGNYDGVLAYGEVIRNIYLKEGWAQNAWTWHEAADTHLFKPLEDKCVGDLVWIGNWGDDERTKELHEYLIQPVRELGLKAKIYGVRYPPEAIRALEKAGIEYGGWLPNYKAPEVFAHYRVTLHVPRGPYVQSLPGIPTIRPFEALACGIPMASSPWNDAENLFRPGKDFLFVNSGAEMSDALEKILTEDELARELATNGLNTILSRHTCAHRVDELLGICEELGIKNLNTQRVAI
jgi:spore maturation protein CgeB